MMCFSIYAGISLWSKKINAVRIAKIYLKTLLIYTVIGATIPFLLFLPREVNDAMLAELSKVIWQPFLFFFIWSSYLNKSRRVKNTFPNL
jgi:hypothetical protein